MARIWFPIVFCLAACACTSPAAPPEGTQAAKSLDREQLQSELTDLKTVASELLARISGLEKQLGQEKNDRPLKVNDILVVKFALASHDLISQSQQDEPRPASSTQEKLIKKVAVAIDEILPNGDYRLRGHRTYLNNGSRHTETLSGVVSKEYIDSQRQIDSDNIRKLRVDIFEEQDTRSSGEINLHRVP